MKSVLVYIAVTLCFGWSAAVVAGMQERQAQAGGHPVPPDLVIEELRGTYARLFAEEVVVRYRGPQGGERSEMYTVRIDPGPDPERRPRRVLLELGPLRVLFADGQMTAVNQADPERYVQAGFEGLITPEVAARMLPPLPLPHLALAARDDDGLRAPTPYTPDTVWTSGVLDASTIPATMRLAGESSHGNATLLANADTIRLMRIAVQIGGSGGQGRAGDAAMELTMRGIDPGDPELWVLDVAGREPVASLSELRPVRRAGPIPVGERVPDLGFARTDMSRWSLYSALRAAQAVATPGEEPQPVAVILVRVSMDHEEVGQRLQEASAALRVLRAGGEGVQGVSQIGVAGITTLSDFSRERWDAARAAWANLDGAGARDELLQGHSPTQSIELFDADAAAALVLIGADRSLRRVVRLDGLDREQIKEALRKQNGPE